MKANIVVIGGGIIGVSVAYHLVEMGVQDVLLLDKGDLDDLDGSTGHAPGGLRVLTANEWFTRLGSKSSAMYDKLPLAVEGEEQFYHTGSLQIASEQWRFDSYTRLQEWGMTYGQPTHLLTPDQVKEKVSFLDETQIVGGVYLPNGGVVKTGRLATSMRRLGEATGQLTSAGNTLVTDIVVENGAIKAVLTDNPEMPRIDCE